MAAAAHPLVIVQDLAPLAQENQREPKAL